MLANSDAFNCRLENFEGPVDFLLYLIQKKEIDILQTSVSELAHQFTSYIRQAQECNLEVSAEFLSTAASLMLIKSKSLLPQEGDEPFDDVLDPKFEIIHKLVEYSEFKKLAKVLLEREEGGGVAFYNRGQTLEIPEKGRPDGLSYLSLEEISACFEQVLDRAKLKTGEIEEEEWRVSDLMTYLEKRLSICEKIPFTEAFSPEKSKNQLIVTFLALLELMKNQLAMVVRLEEAIWIHRFIEMEDEQGN